SHDSFDLLDHGGAAAGRHLERAEIALAVKQAIRQRLLAIEQMQDLVLDRAFADQVGQQSPLAECKTQCAFTLIGKKRAAQQVEARGAVSDLGEEGGARLFARALPALPVEPGCKVT